MCDGPIWLCHLVHNALFGWDVFFRVFLLYRQEKNGRTDQSVRHRAERDGDIEALKQMSTALQLNVDS